MRSWAGRFAASAVAFLSIVGSADAQPTAARGVRVDAREEHYLLEERTLGEVIARLNAMRLEGPLARRSQGLTSWHIRPSWHTAVSPGSCRVGALEVRVRIVLTLPRWAGFDAAPAPERSRWERISALIRDHEHAHRDLTIDAAGRLYETLAGLEAGSCATLGRAVDAALAITRGELAEAHRALDEATPERIVGAITES